ncbi:uncharacterized protein F5Z01DRAFT_155502 [Emericellopsis atlantica]|uniref:Uncharacterized protein n=1 Tax=Emericellopsis atlantica TaxID=2614577 RepID=A0A9P8CPX6_9HYPO|nr:uncharacterized protein F5Z01DRAFT_155502 [Emericellopsis atlantica]KAG9253186.1 hypothetical protein F5Z01DRAFT_155502 [Emericellopsis atlantica]
MASPSGATRAACHYYHVRHSEPERGPQWPQSTVYCLVRGTVHALSMVVSTSGNSIIFNKGRSRSHQAPASTQRPSCLRFGCLSSGSLVSVRSLYHTQERSWARAVRIIIAACCFLWEHNVHQQVAYSSILACLSQVSVEMSCAGCPEPCFTVNYLLPMAGYGASDFKESCDNYLLEQKCNDSREATSSRVPPPRHSQPLRSLQLTSHVAGNCTIASPALFSVEYLVELALTIDFGLRRLK